MSDDFVDLSDHNVDLSNNFVDLSDFYVDLPLIHVFKNSTLKRFGPNFTKLGAKHPYGAYPDRNWGTKRGSKLN